MSYLEGRRGNNIIKCVICRKLAKGTYKDGLPICYQCKGIHHGAHMTDYKKGDWNFRQSYKQ